MDEEIIAAAKTVSSIRADLIRTVEGGIECAKLENEDFVFTHFRVETAHSSQATLSNVDRELVGKNIKALLDAVFEELGDVTGLEPGEVWFTHIGVSWAGRELELFVFDG